ncbi:hypothetical protein NAI02_12085, partial [Francisella tularensis subsp. holarctica]|nr:hypothetical protein [Francisella tularensis subsp. holarctica]
CNLQCRSRHIRLFNTRSRGWFTDKKIGPEAFDNIYSGPMITAFYHFNDIHRMNVNSTNDWYFFNDQGNKCLENSQKN